MIFIDSLEKSEFWQRHANSIVFITNVLVFSFMPVWITIFLLVITKGWLTLGDVATGGAFFIYATGLLGSAIYIMRPFAEKAALPKITILQDTCTLLLILSAVGFTFSIIPEIPDFLEIKPVTIGVVSFLFTLLSLVILYIVHYDYVGSSASSPDDKNEEDIKEIMNEI